jgi:hypothetical protein
MRLIAGDTFLGLGKCFLQGSDHSLALGRCTLRALIRNTGMTVEAFIELL